MFYLALFGFCLFYFLMGFAVLAIGLTDHNKHTNQFNGEDFGMLVMFVGIIILATYTIHAYIKSAPSIRLNKNSIELGLTTYYWNDLEDISLTGKKPYLFNDEKEGVMLKFKDESARYFLDEMYANTPEIKQFIRHHIMAEVKERQQPHEPDIKDEQFVSYKGKAWLNYRSFLLWCFIGLLIYIGISHIGNLGLLILLLGIGLGAFRIGSWYIYYFDLSDNYFVVKNHNMFWVSKIYPLSNIQQIVFEQPYKMPGSIRVITKDFKSKLFRAGTIPDRQWIDLKNTLEKKHITVRDEFVYAIAFYEFTFFKEIRDIFKRLNQ